VSALAEGAEPRPASDAPRLELVEMLQGVRQELMVRGEDLSGEWVEGSASDLASGVKPGWYLGGADGGLAFYARRGSAAFGHLHAGPAGTEVAGRLARALLRGLPEDVLSLDLGFTGLSPENEKALVRRLSETPGSTVIERQAMERPLSAADGRLPSEPPAGVDRVPVSAVTVDALAALDEAAFRGSIEELLMGSEPDAHRRSLEAVLGGRLGRFLGEASAALVESEPTRLVGVVLTAERSSHRAIVHDLMVDPERRRRGLGRFLLGWTMRALWALGYENARLWVSLRNVAASGLYASFGFRTTLEATIYRWDRGGPPPQPQTSR
jgi:ribosomal protein S18 acetylase RimI-like enzyme